MFSLVFSYFGTATIFDKTVILNEIQSLVLVSTEHPGTIQYQSQ